MILMLMMCCLVGWSRGHGFLANPVSRNVKHPNWCPQCLSGPEVCGDPRGRHDYESRGKYATSPQTFKRGDVVPATVVITANHQGRWRLELCRGGPEKESCFVPLRRVDAPGTYVYLKSDVSVSRAKFRLPRDVRCHQCVLRWRWETGNTCNPAGTPARYRNPYVSTCKPGSGMERFTNCADIRIE